MARTSIVVRTMAVRPVSTGPTQAKWSSQMSRRGLNNRVNNPVSGSKSPRFGTFWEVPIQAGQRQVFGDGRSEVLLSNDVVDLERQNVEPLWKPTVFASVSGAVPNQTFQCLVHLIKRQAKPARAIQN